MKKSLIGPGDLIVGAWDILKKNFRSYTQLAVWFTVLSLIQWVIFIITRSFIFNGFYRSIVINALSLPILIVFALLYVAVIDLTARTIQKKSADMHDIFSKSLHTLIPFIWVTALFWTIMGFGIMLLVIPAILFFVWFKFAANNLVVDGVHGFDALRASKLLVDGRWWAVLFRIVIPAIFFYVAASFALKLLYLLIGSSLGDPGFFFSNFTSSDELSNSYILITSVIPAIVNAYLLPLLVAVDLLLWFDLKRTA